MEVPIYDDLPMLGSAIPDGPGLILCIAIPNPDPVAIPEKPPFAVQYAKFLAPLERSSYRLGEEQVTREMAHKMTRRFLSPVVSSELGGLIGASPTMTIIKRRIEILAPTNTSIILLGKTGTGKTEMAKMLHLSSGRAQPRRSRSGFR